MRKQYLLIQFLIIQTFYATEMQTNSLEIDSRLERLLQEKQALEAELLQDKIIRKSANDLRNTEMKSRLKTPADKLSYVMGMGLGQKAFMMTSQDNTLKLNMNKLLEGVQSVINQKDTSFSYLMGVQMGLGIKDMLNKSAEDLTYKINPSITMQAIKAAYEAGADTSVEFAMTQEEILKIQQDYRAYTDMKVANQSEVESQKFLNENQTKVGVTTTETGLQYQILIHGKGAKPRIGQDISVNYKGWLLNGQVFDENTDAKFSLQEEGLIQGWIEALQLMNVGSKWKLWVPADLAYGIEGVKRDDSSGVQTVIPPNAALVFEIELKRIGPAKSMKKTVR